MPTGLVALLDDVAVIARTAAASLDDVSAAATKAGSKAAGVVIDDAAVTPSYVTDFTPDRELPVIARIARGSLFNKLVILLPVALLLSAVLPGAITPLLMAGGLFLCFEGAEKLLEKLTGEKHGQTLEDRPTDAVTFENERVSGAVRTDLILSAEIMAIALAEVADEGIVLQAAILAVVGIAITVIVYGTVGLIVKMDDIGLRLTKGSSSAAKGMGTFLLRAMPVLLTFLSIIGTAAMLWVGGSIILHGLEVLGMAGPAHVEHAARHWVEQATGPLGGIFGWLTHAVLSALVGIVLGAIVAGIVHMVARTRGAH
ncbi:DUF808 domain-containing protein [Novosphingobium flavum]|uniref:DUF808 domain-containing protein n=1 Tax=Novosphingobium aerophilum TaxID=2839843 RepID=A0A7X1F9L6_9SPHN|nr:DUF808 domain-containing protein [Novosphingobium aerophilum]MBC2652958.1 DUF808 domain-containing protein [Novosphingobium aerophilum]MBC2662038.1 DUF808 domain-containing protein [Novosphingobium aerophilum]